MPLSEGPDKSNGYEGITGTYIARRARNGSAIGASVVADWSKRLPDAASVLDLGCGNGIPISKTLMERGFSVYGVDASPRMTAAFRGHFPTSPVQTAAVEDSDFFGRTFEGVVAWGLFFLLDAQVQRKLIPKIAAALAREGKLLFTAPNQACNWLDAMTGRPSISLGYSEYERLLAAEGLTVVGTAQDEGENYYYFAQKA